MAQNYNEREYYRQRYEAAAKAADLNAELQRRQMAVQEKNAANNFQLGLMDRSNAKTKLNMDRQVQDNAIFADAERRRLAYDTASGRVSPDLFSMLYGGSSGASGKQGTSSGFDVVNMLNDAWKNRGDDDTRSYGQFMNEELNSLHAKDGFMQNINAMTNPQTKSSSSEIFSSRGADGKLRFSDNPVFGNFERNSGNNTAWSQSMEGAKKRNEMFSTTPVASTPTTMRSYSKRGGADQMGDLNRSTYQRTIAQRTSEDRRNQRLRGAILQNPFSRLQY